MITKVKVILINAFIILVLTACAAKPETTVENYLMELKGDITSDFETIAIEEYFDSKVNFGVENSVSKDESGAVIENEFTQRYQELFQDFDYVINDSVIDGDQSVVNIEITTYPIAELLTKYFSELFANVFSWSLSGMSQDEIDQKSQKLFIDLSANIQKTYVSIVPVNLNKVDGKWYLDGADNDQLFNALTGGTFEYFQQIAK